MPNDRLLIVDDDPAILYTAARTLDREGYQITTVDSGEKALRELRDHHFDLLLADVMMPQVSGLQVLQAVRERNTDLAVVIITGQGTVTTAIRALELGADGFVIKPFTVKELSSAITQALRKSRIRQENSRLKALVPLFEASRHLMLESDPERLLRLIVETAARQTGAGHARLLLLDQDQRLTERARIGRPQTTDEPSPELLAHATSGALRPEGAREGLVTRGDSAPTLWVPLVVKGRTIGVLGVGQSLEASGFAAGDGELLAILSGHAAAALENQRLYQDLETSYLQTTSALANALEIKDAYTGGHCERLAEYSVAVAQHLRLPKPTIDAIRLGATLHDIGKIGIADSILGKPDKLTPEEYETMKQHTVLGAQILAPVDCLQAAAPLIRGHHERFDGAGYPDGLKGESIPLGARILSVADAFEAMTSNRPYRKALPLAVATSRMKEAAGTQFDPAMVAAFLDTLPHLDLVAIGTHSVMVS